MIITKRQQLVASAFTAPSLGIGAILFPVRNRVISTLAEEASENILAVQEASDFFVEAFWTGKVGGGSKELTTQQERELQMSQSAEFNKRYAGGISRFGGGMGKRTADLLLCRAGSSSESNIVACAGVEVDRIPAGSLRGPTEVQAAPLMSNLAVSRQYRRRGLAEKLVAAVEDLVGPEGWGYDVCYLYVEERNRGANRLYEKLGYRRQWKDNDAKTLLPTEDGVLLSSSTTIVCMKKFLRPKSGWGRWLG